MTGRTDSARTESANVATAPTTPAPSPNTAKRWRSKEPPMQNPCEKAESVNLVGTHSVRPRVPVHVHRDGKEVAASRLRPRERVTHRNHDRRGDRRVLVGHDRSCAHPARRDATGPRVRTRHRAGRERGKSLESYAPVLPRRRAGRRSALRRRSRRGRRDTAKDNQNNATEANRSSNESSKKTSTDIHGTTFFWKRKARL